MANNYAADFFGSIATVYVANYADERLSRVLEQMKNSTGVKLLALAGSVFLPEQEKSFFSKAMRGSGSWAAGSIVEPYIQRHFTNVSVAPSVKVSPQGATPSATI